MDFRIDHFWTKRSVPVPLDEAYLADDELLWAGIERFHAVYEGWFRIPLRPEALTFDLFPDLSSVFDDLPGWLDRIAAPDADEARLLFASQGTELFLVAERRADGVTLRAEAMDPERPLLPAYGPVTVAADEFLREWTGFLFAFLDAVAEQAPSARDDPRWPEYRAAIERLVPAKE